MIPVSSIFRQPGQLYVNKLREVMCLYGLPAYHAFFGQVAADARTPPEVLLQLATTHPQEVGRNPLLVRISRPLTQENMSTFPREDLVLIAEGWFKLVTLTLWRQWARQVCTWAESVLVPSVSWSEWALLGLAIRVQLGSTLLPDLTRERVQEFVQSHEPHSFEMILSQLRSALLWEEVPLSKLAVIVPDSLFSAAPTAESSTIWRALTLCRIAGKGFPELPGVLGTLDDVEERIAHGG